MIFAYASLVTHQLFRTDPRDMSKNNTSSYLDLSVLYGTNQDQQDLVRDKAKGLGLLHPDAFAEDRLVLVPPAATALLVLFSRNHNVSQIIVPDGAKFERFPLYSTSRTCCSKSTRGSDGRTLLQRTPRSGPPKMRRFSKLLAL